MASCASWPSRAPPVPRLRCGLRTAYRSQRHRGNRCSSGRFVHPNTPATTTKRTWQNPQRPLPSRRPMPPRRHGGRRRPGRHRVRHRRAASARLRSHLHRECCRRKTARMASAGRLGKTVDPPPSRALRAGRPLVPRRRPPCDRVPPHVVPAPPVRVPDRRRFLRCTP